MATSRSSAPAKAAGTLLAFVALLATLAVATPARAVANNAPAFTDTTLMRNIAENTAADTNIGAVIPEATDVDGDTLIYTMEGTDADSFTFDATARQIKTKDALDFETQESYSVTIKADDSKGGTATVGRDHRRDGRGRPARRTWGSDGRGGRRGGCGWSGRSRRIMAGRRSPATNSALRKAPPCRRSRPGRHLVAIPIILHCWQRGSPTARPMPSRCGAVNSAGGGEAATVSATPAAGCSPPSLGSRRSVWSGDNDGGEIRVPTAQDSLGGQMTRGSIGLLVAV